MQNVGAAWLMGDLSSSPTLVALVQTATLLPVFLIGLPAGALADIFDRRHLLIVVPDLDAGDRRAAGHADLLGPGHARIAAVPDVLPRHRRRTDTAGVAGHPAGARAPCRVPAGHRPRRPHLQPGPGRRPCPRWCRRGRRRPAVGLPHQRRLVPRRRRRAPLVAPGRSGVQAAGGDDGRRHPGRAALRRQLVRAAPRPHPRRGLRVAGRRRAQPAAGDRPRPARPRVRRLRPPAGRLRHRCRPGRRSCGPASMPCSPRTACSAWARS